MTSQSNHPFSSISLSPEGKYAVASGRDVLHVLRLGLGDKMEEIRSVRIAQYFQSNTGTLNRGPSSIQNSQYTHMHDALRISGAPTTTPTGGGGGGVNVNVTDVAWSLPQTFVLDNGVGGSGTSSGKGVSDNSDSLDGLFSPSMDALDFEQNTTHHPPFINRVHAKLASNPTSPVGNEPAPTIDDSSVLAAAGSNGVIVAWHARSALLAPKQHETMTPGRHDRWGAGSNNANNPQVTSAATIGQPEAMFLAHSRAINRITWHPTGRRPYLLLSGSQDGLVKLWDRRATTSSVASASNNIVANRSTWFGFGGGSSTKQVPDLFTQNKTITTATWHCCSTYQPKCEAVRDIKWSPFMDDVFAMVAGEWLLTYDIRFPNRPIMKESAHAGEATSVDWHPTNKYKIATGGSRDRCVKVWNIESGLNVEKQDDASENLKANANSISDSESVSITSSEGVIVANPKKDVVIADTRGIQAANQGTLGSTISSGSTSPIKRIASGDRFRTRKNLPTHVLAISSPVTRIRWRPPEETHAGEDNYHESMIAVATSPISGANAGGHGVMGLWSCHRPFMPVTLCEGHVDGAVVDFAWATESEEKKFERKWQTVITVGRDGQCLLQNFSRGHFPISEVPCSTFALTNLSPFQPGYGSLQIVAVHQHVNAVGVVRGKTAPSPISNSELAFSVTDQGDLKDLSGEVPLPDSDNDIDIAPEVTHLSRLSEMYITKTGSGIQTKVDACNHNAAVAERLNRKALTQMWKTIAIILKGSGLGHIPSSHSSLPKNPMANLLLPTLRKLLLQRADAGDVQSCVVLCEIMDVIVPPVTAGGLAKSRLPNLGIDVVREWYLSYIDLLQQMCLFTQAASLIKNCNDPIVGSLNQQSTTIHESCPVCGKPLQGGSNSSCKSCRRKVGRCFICHESVKGMFVWCPGCGHGGHLDHALEWFGKNEFCPTGCGHKCNLFPNKQCNPVPK